MAKLSLINRDQKRRALVKKYAKKREALLAIRSHSPVTRTRSSVAPGSSPLHRGNAVDTRPKPARSAGFGAAAARLAGCAYFFGWQPRCCVPA